MEHYAGIDVSLELLGVCVVDAQGKIVKSEPEALVAFFGALGFTRKRPCPGHSASRAASWHAQSGGQGPGRRVAGVQGSHAGGLSAAEPSDRP